MPPDNNCSGNKTKIIIRPNCGIERAMVAIKIPIEVVANSCSAAHNKNNATEPSTGTASKPWITQCNDKPVASSTTAPIARIFDSIISAGVTGITSKCSMVPCSRSRISAAPVSTIEIIVTILISSITAPNQALFRFGLNLARSTKSTGNWVFSRCLCRYSLISAAVICSI